MATLGYPSPAELQLCLEAHDGAILDVVRKCPWWTRADIEGRVPGTSTVTRVTLIAPRANDSTLRRILQLSFGLVFPAEGGAGVQRGQPDRLAPPTPDRSPSKP